MLRRYSVINVWSENVQQSALINELGDALDADFWQRGTLGTPARVMASPEQRVMLEQQLSDEGIRFQIDIEDVASQLKREDEQLASYRNSRTSRKLFQDYPSYDEVNTYIEELAAKYPSTVNLTTIGDSFENRPIKYLKLSTSNFEDATKPIFFLDALIHAREWVTTPTVLYGLDRLLENPTKEDSWLLENVDWIIVPIVNPDGYEFTRSENRMWRGTRSINRFINTTCLGVDGNRNFDVSWNTTGVSQDPCTQTYPGGEPFSEPETRHIRDLMHEHIDRLHFYMNIHSHGNYVLYPYGSGENPPDTAVVHFVGAAMGAAMDARKIDLAGHYLVGNSMRMLYGTSGSAQDYAAKIGVPLAYTLELPGYGHGFQVPPEYIDQINMETWQGLREAAKLTKMLYDIRK